MADHVERAPSDVGGLVLFVKSFRWKRGEKANYQLHGTRIVEYMYHNLMILHIEISPYHQIIDFVLVGQIVFDHHFNDLVPAKSDRRAYLDRDYRKNLARCLDVGF